MSGPLCRWLILAGLALSVSAGARAQDINIFNPEAKGEIQTVSTDFGDFPVDPDKVRVQQAAFESLCVDENATGPMRSVDCSCLAKKYFAMARLKALKHQLDARCKTAEGVPQECFYDDPVNQVDYDPVGGDVLLEMSRDELVSCTNFSELADMEYGSCADGDSQCGCKKTALIDQVKHSPFNWFSGAAAQAEISDRVTATCGE